MVAMVEGEQTPLLESQIPKRPRLQMRPSIIPRNSFRVANVQASSEFQTVVNSINVLVGVGLLSLPLAMHYAGWIFGTLLFVLSATIARYAARSLTACMHADRSLKTYIDVAGASYGTCGQVVASVLFSLNMMFACVALLIFFGDTVVILVPSMSTTTAKIICGLIVLPMQFVSLRSLAPVSMLGVASCIGIVGVVIIAGLINTSGPGSLHTPAPTNLMPPSWLAAISSIGLFMSPWGATGTFPTIQQDMKNPRAFGTCLSYAFVSTFIIDAAMAVCGYLMFGVYTLQEVTSNILNLSGGHYPHPLLTALVLMTAILPITKITLNSRPLIVMIETTFLGPDLAETDEDDKDDGTETPLSVHFWRTAIRIFAIAVAVVVSIAIPSFDRVIALIGSALCYTISAILPLLFCLKMTGKTMSPWRKVFDRALIVVCVVLATLGTGAALFK